jgi:thiamine biosynthesis lipoprotein
MQTARIPDHQSRRFRAMGSDMHVIVVGGRPELADDAQRRVEELERRWSRFRPDSEVSALNAGAGAFVVVSPETRTLVRRAVEAWRLSGGTFDPTMLAALVAAGYGRSFEDGPIAMPVPSGLPPMTLAGCSDIVIDGDAVCLPAGTGFDPGGIGKGLAADLVAEEVLAEGAAGVCVNAGGDVRVAGDRPDDESGGEAWTIAVEHPRATAPVALLGLKAGAVATSTTLLRAWVLDGRPAHHLIDPATGRPSDSDLTLASVVTGRAWRAEVLAKTVLLRGGRWAFDVLDDDAEALIVDRDGVIRTTPGWSAFMGGRPPAARLDTVAAA